MKEKEEPVMKIYGVGDRRNPIGVFACNVDVLEEEVLGKVVLAIAANRFGKCTEEHLMDILLEIKKSAEADVVRGEA